MPHSAYQIDYVAANCGKIVPASKRHIRFKFGYTNLDALSNGKTGQHCRGSEHEVSITWSLSSGKQAIAFDQTEVFFDVGDSTHTKFTHCWKDGFGHVLEVRVHAARMSTKNNPHPDWKQYDIIIDGVSFFRMPKIFQLGIFAKEHAADSELEPKFAQSPASRTSPIQAPQMESILPPNESKNPEPEPDLLSFDDLDGPALASAPVTNPPPQLTTPAQANMYAPFQAPDEAPSQSNYAFAQASSQANYAHVQAPAQATYAHVQLQQNCAPANSFHTHDQARYNYISPNTSPVGQGNNTSAATQDPSAFYLPPTMPAESGPYNERGNASPAYTAYAPQANPVTPTSPSTALVPTHQAPTGYGVEGAVNNLANIDDIFGATMSSPATKESVDARVQESNTHKSLGHLQGSHAGNPKKPVMNTFNPAPAYQQQQGMYNGYDTHQQQQHQHQYSGFGYQQSYAQPQPGFSYQ